MIRKPISPRQRIALGVAAVLVLMGFYTVLSSRQHSFNPEDTTVPSWTQLSERLVQVVTPHPRDGTVWLWNDAWATLGRLGGGFALAILLAVPLGMAMGCYTPVGAFFLPPLAFLAKVPAIAVSAIFLILVGSRYELYLAMIVFGVLPSLALTVYHAAKEDVPDELLNKASTLGASQMEIIWNVIFRQILPRMLDAVRLQIGPAMIYLIAAEMLYASVGLGYRIRIQSRLLDMSTAYLYVVFLGGLGLGLDYGLTWLRRKLCPWYDL